MSFAKTENWKILKNEFKYGVVISQKEKILPLKFFLNTDTLYSLCCTNPLESDHANNK